MSIQIDRSLPVRDLYVTLTHDFPALAPLASSLLYAVNEEYVSGDHMIADGDTVAFLPPISGG